MRFVNAHYRYPHRRHPRPTAQEGKTAHAHEEHRKHEKGRDDQEAEQCGRIGAKDDVGGFLGGSGG